MSESGMLNVLMNETADTDVSVLVEEQFSQLHRLKDNVKNQLEKAELAQISVDEATKKKVGLFSQKKSVQSVISAVQNLSDAQIVAAETQGIALEYQQKLAEIMRYLFGLGVTNIALNRSLVRELELRLNNATEEELDEYARQEIVGVVKQLKAQEDILVKVDNLKLIVKEQDATIQKHEAWIKKLTIITAVAGVIAVAALVVAIVI